MYCLRFLAQAKAKSQNPKLDQHNFQIIARLSSKLIQVIVVVRGNYKERMQTCYKKQLESYSVLSFIYVI